MQSNFVICAQIALSLYLSFQKRKFSRLKKKSEISVQNVHSIAIIVDDFIDYL